MEKEITVIVPVFKVSRFIERCARAVLEQTFDSIEYIFVDDCSPDDSVEILERVIAEYPDRADSVRILHHDQNRGLPSARNTGIEAASGRYIYHCDSDDWVEKDMLKTMYDAAVSNDADMVYCDFYLTFAKNERYMTNPDFTSADEMLRSMLHGEMKYNVWNKLIRRSLYQTSGVRFPSDHPKGGEDTTILMLSATADKVVHVPQAFYHYDKTGEGAITKTRSERHFDDIKCNTRRTIDYISAVKGDSYKDELAYFKLAIKFPFLISDEQQLFDLWTAWFPEANGYIRNNPFEPVRNKVLEIAAARGWFWIPKWYYRIVFRFLYGIIYR